MTIFTFANNFSFSGDHSLFVTKNRKGDIKFWATDPTSLTWNLPNTDNQSMVSSCSASFSVFVLPDFTELTRASPSKRVNNENVARGIYSNDPDVCRI